MFSRNQIYIAKISFVTSFRKLSVGRAYHFTKCDLRW